MTFTQFYSDVPPNRSPIPAALPLFVTGLGALGMLGWRRKRKNAAALAAALIKTPDRISERFNYHCFLRLSPADPPNIAWPKRNMPERVTL
jgi:hypothetical protein